MGGPDGSISIDQGTIDEQARNLGDLKNELERAIQITSTQIQSLYESGAFKSVSGASFQDLYAKWIKESGEMIGVLDEFALYLGKAGAAFTEVDNAYKINL